MSDRPALELIVLCGALGSGKTTLLSQFLAQRDLRNTAVIVNEAGAVGIDAAVLQAASPDDPVLLLDNGCVCCSLRGSLVQTLLDLLHQPRPIDAPPLTRVVIESSGISRPGPMLASLRDRDLLPFHPAIRVVCTFDAAQPAPAMADTHRKPDRFDEDAANRTRDALENDRLAQWAAAHRIVITRTDVAGGIPMARAVALAQSINPLARVIAHHDPQRRAEQALAPEASGDDSADGLVAGLEQRDPVAVSQPMPDGSPGSDPPWFSGLLSRSAAHPRLVVLQGRPQEGLRWGDFAAWVDDLAGLLGERLLRFKAVVAPSDRPDPLMLQGVGTTFSAPVRAQAVYERLDSRASIIVIARDTSAFEIANELPDAPVRLSRVESRITQGGDP